MFEVAVSTTQSRPEGLLAKTIDDRRTVPAQDASRAHFVDWNPRVFDIGLEVHRGKSIWAVTTSFSLGQGRDIDERGRASRAEIFSLCVFARSTPLPP